MKFEENQEQLRKLDGMQAALAHAFDMNKNGRLDPRELDEFRRYLISESIAGMTQEQHMQARKDGSFDRLMEGAGQNPRDEKEMHPDDLAKTRKEIAGKIAADYMGQLWEGGHIDDAGYTEQMTKLGVAPDSLKGLSKSDAAAKAWAKANGADKETKETPAEREERFLAADQAEMAAYVAERKKEWDAQDRARDNGTTVEHERTVGMPDEHSKASNAA